MMGVRYFLRDHDVDDEATSLAFFQNLLLTRGSAVGFPAHNHPCSTVVNCYGPATVVKYWGSKD